MKKLNIFDKKNLKYYLDHSNMVRMNGKPDGYTNLMHAYNTFLNLFWIEHFGGIAFWAKDSFLLQDVKYTTESFIELVNKPEDKMNIGLITFIQHLKPASHFKLSGAIYVYPSPFTYYINDKDEYGIHPRVILDEVMKLVKHDSLKKEVEKLVNEAGLPYISLIVD